MGIPYSPLRKAVCGSESLPRQSGALVKTGQAETGSAHPTARIIIFMTAMSSVINAV